MHDRTYLLIDFENVQPSAKDFEQVRGSQYRIRIFHGPHQVKFDADLVRALQPLGAQVEYVPCSRKGKNALDFHITYALGRLVEEGARDAAPAASGRRFAIVSKDLGFDALLEYLVEAGVRVTRVATVSEAVAWAAATARAKEPPAASAPSGTNPADAPAPPAKKAPTKSAKAATAEDAYARLVDNLREHPANRPATRIALLRHVATSLGKLALPTAEEVVARLERAGIVAIADGKIAYRIPKAAG